MLAGSSVLAALTGTFEPNDLDIWLRLEDTSKLLCEEDKHAAEKTNGLRLNTLHRFLLESEYQRDYRSRDAIAYMEMDHLIHRIHNYTNKAGKKIQLISTKQRLSTVLNDFDLNICCCWWQGRSIYARHPMALLRREFELYSERQSKLTVHRLGRIDKYIGRGFKPSARLLEQRTAETDVHMTDVVE